MNISAAMYRKRLLGKFTTRSNTSCARVTRQLAGSSFHTSSQVNNTREDLVGESSAPLPVVRKKALRLFRVQKSLDETWEPWADEPNNRFDKGLRSVLRTESAETVLPLVRAVPESPSYFSYKWFQDDRMVKLRKMITRYAHLKKMGREDLNEFKPISATAFKELDPTGKSGRGDYVKTMNVISRLAKSQPSLRPPELVEEINKYSSKASHVTKVAPKHEIDIVGRTLGTGRRKDAVAQVWLVKGTGEVLVNGKRITEVFTRTRDRESALRPLDVVGMLGSFNVFVLVHGGGTTGQSAAVSLGVARALRLYNPSLTSILRKANCLFRDRRITERKKPGKLKARKAPQWVKR